MELVYGAGRLDRCVSGIDELLRARRDQERDLGQLYLMHEPFTPPDSLLVEDLAATMLLNSRIAAGAATSAARHGPTVELGILRLSAALLAHSLVGLNRRRSRWR